MLSADYIFVAAIALVIACNFYFGPRIKRERVAMQWGSDGKPTWYAPRLVAIWWMIPFMIAVRSVIWLASMYDTKRVHGAELGVVLLSVISAASHIFVLKMAGKAD
ncbi:hypothetical protein SAMN05444158_0646 [Bradyrhizobium canariense]|uniref:DUF1648 domain-containing protein n=1 Tax=Bradyrhizobium canariense TaxID=255045 RepID=A0A1H1NIY7_9BRAD|nr:hypothetical protein SAMN05444158_0646 [Bradyrhizobium canariense]